jgi:hypothetical protein
VGPTPHRTDHTQRRRIDERVDRHAHARRRTADEAREGRRGPRPRRSRSVLRPGDAHVAATAGAAVERGLRRLLVRLDRARAPRLGPGDARCVRPRGEPLAGASVLPAPLRPRTASAS